VNKKIINLVTAIAIYFTIAVIIELFVGWGIENKWIFIAIWSVLLAFADVFIFQKFRQRAAVAKKEKQNLSQRR
jgi:hypothetical protein